MRHEQVDGVRVLWDDLPGCYQGALVVGCGARDEDIDQFGLTTLVVKLVVDAAAADDDDEDNEDVEYDSTDLTAALVNASGSPERVTAYFADCCAALADLPLGELARVASTVGPVDRLMYLFALGAGCRDPWGSLLARRLGRSGPGLMRWPVVDSAEFTAEEVRSHAARHFTADNVVFGLSGAPTNSLRLPLPPGPPQPRASAPPATRFGGCWYTDEVDGVGIAISGTLGAVAIAVHLVLAERVRAQLKHGDLEYSAKPTWTPLDPDRVEFGLALRPEDRYSMLAPAATAQLLWQELRRLASEPPDREEIEVAVAGAAPPDVTDPEHVREQQTDKLYQAAQRMLIGISDDITADEYALAAEVSSSDVRSAAASWMATATVVVPTGTEVELPGMTRGRCPVSHFVPTGVVLESLSRPPFWRRRKAAVSERLVLGDDAFHLVGVDGAVHTFPLADIIVVDDGPLLMLGNIAHGCLVDISAYGGRQMFADRLPDRRYRKAGTY